MTYANTLRIALIDGDAQRRAKLRACVEGDVVDNVQEGVEVILVDAARVSAIVTQHPDIVVVAVASDAASGGAALRAGAYDVIAEPFDAERVQAAVRRARERQELSRKLHFLQNQLNGQQNGHDEGVVPLRELERRAIEKALAASRGSVEKAARMLGMGRATLYRRLATMNPSRVA